jgi:alkylated DNA repair dioxygenase AlkB
MDSAYLITMTAKGELFEPTVAALPDGMDYREEILSKRDEDAAVRYIAELPLKPFEFAGGFKGNRRVMSFGFRYDYSQQRLIEAAPIPGELQDIRDIVAARMGHHPNDLRQALVTEYAPGAGIGWHRDKKMFGEVLGVSLLAPCNFRLRRKVGGQWQRMFVQTRPRSAYCLSGEARNMWEHSIPPLDRLRYSITFRTFAGDAQRTPRGI